MKKNIYLTLLLIFAFLVHSCQTVNQISIDYLVPSDVSFPEQIKRVGIINNVNEPTGTRVDIVPDSVLAQFGSIYKLHYLSADAQVTTNALAEAIAAENYFDMVVICDSALRANDTVIRETTLHKEEINQLTEDLEVDMLIALEQCWVKVKRSILHLPGLGYISTIDATVSPQLKLYLPERSTPLVTINSRDSIFWEEVYGTETAARTRHIPDEQLVAEASTFSGTIPIKHLLPYWKTASRFFFADGSSEMRDAAFFVRNNNWNDALPLWEKVFQTKGNKMKARAASNISLYYEGQDDLEKATEWGKKALELIAPANKEDNLPIEIDPDRLTDYHRILFNQLDIARRESDWGKLNTQMKRFDLGL